MASQASEATFAGRVTKIGERFGDVEMAIQYDPRGREWVVAIHFGREAEDSPMVGGAAYGVDADLGAALEQALGEVGV